MTLPIDVLKKYAKHPYVGFVETGTNNGDGIQTALDLNIFNVIHSIEIFPDKVKKARERFSKNTNINIHEGDSSIILKNLLHEIPEHSIFWLDSHFSEDIIHPIPIGNSCPILEELKILKNFKHSLFLIDDIRYFRGNGIPQWNNVKLGSILNALREINSNFKFDYENGFCENDILVAYC